MDKQQGKGTINSVFNPQLIKEIEGEFSKATNYHKESEIEKYRIDPSIEIPEPPAILTINGAPLTTLGDFSLIMGKAKSRKTTWITVCVATCIKQAEIFPGLVSNFNPDDQILYFDTEQGDRRAYKTLKKICYQAGESNPANLHYYNLRPLSAKKRLELINDKIETTFNTKLVIIDGARDLLERGINDEEGATKLTEKILQWTFEKNLHIIVVLHQNKGDFNARGHIGTELVNKAETVLSIAKDQKDKNISIVTPEYCRDIDFEPVYFTMNENGIPEPCDIPGKQSNIKTEKMKENFIRLLNDNPLRYTPLCNEYMELSGFQERTAKSHISDGLKAGFLKKGKDELYRLQIETEIYI